MPESPHNTANHDWDPANGLLYCKPEIKNDGDISDVLVLETKEHLEKDVFAWRVAKPNFQGENNFVLTSNWTPEGMTSKPTVIYFYGNLAKMKQAVAFISKVCPNLAAILSSGLKSSNSLKVSVSAEYNGPIFYRNISQAISKGCLQVTLTIQTYTNPTGS